MTCCCISSVQGCAKQTIVRVQTRMFVDCSKMALCSTASGDKAARYKFGRSKEKFDEKHRQGSLSNQVYQCSQWPVSTSRSVCQERSFGCDLTQKRLSFQLEAEGATVVGERATCRRQPSARVDVDRSSFTDDEPGLACCTENGVQLDEVELCEWLESVDVLALGGNDVLMLRFQSRRHITTMLTVEERLGSEERRRARDMYRSCGPPWPS